MRSKAGIVAAAALILAVAWPGSAFAAKKTGPLIVHTSVSPAWAYFGDTMTVRLDVLFNPKVVDPSSVQPSPTFANWQQLSATRFAQSEDGTLVHRTWWYSLDCLTFICLPRGPIVQSYKLPAFPIKAKEADGHTLVITQAWPTLRVSARYLPPKLPSARPVFSLQTQVPAASYRVEPSLLATLFDVGGGILLVAAAAAAGYSLLRRFEASRRRRREQAPIERALALVRDAKGRDPDDRRRAVGLLARTLSPSSRSVPSASKLAWSADEPSPTGLEELAETVESDLGEHA
jgi:hypothetical protein